MSTMTIVMCTSGEIRINDGASVRTFPNANYAAEELARLMEKVKELNLTVAKVRGELNQFEKIDGTTVDLIKNVRRILDEGIPF